MAFLPLLSAVRKLKFGVFIRFDFWFLFVCFCFPGGPTDLHVIDSA